jgi:hypothetical protein
LGASAKVITSGVHRDIGEWLLSHAAVARLLTFVSVPAPITRLSPEVPYSGLWVLRCKASDVEDLVLNIDALPAGKKSDCHAKSKIDAKDRGHVPVRDDDERVHHRGWV